MKPKVSIDDDIMTLMLFGELDHHAAGNVRETADALIQQKRPKELRMDFSGVSFMDSSGIGLIMGRYRMMQLYGGILRVINIPESLRKIMILSGLCALDIMESEVRR